MWIKVLYYVLIALLIILFIILAISLVCYRIVFFHKEKYQPEKIDKTSSGALTYFDTTDKLLEKFINDPNEEIFIRSYDNKIMCGHYYEYEKDAPVIIATHGYKAFINRDYSLIGNVCKKQKYNLLAVDVRSHNKSEGRTISFGAREKYDLLAWIEYVNSRSNKKTPIILYGLSMGAATTLLAASSNDLPKNVVAVVVDSPYDKVDNAIVEIGKQGKINAKPLLPFCHIGAVLFGHFKIKEANPIEVTANIKVPTLIIHGDKDDMVPVECSERISNTNQEFIKRKVYENVKHVQSFIYYTDDYYKLVCEFISNNLDK